MKYSNCPELEIQPGDQVRFTCEKAHEESPQYSPPVGTVGTVMATDEKTGEVEVQWPVSSGVIGLCQWWTFPEWLAFVSREDAPC